MYCARRRNISIDNNNIIPVYSPGVGSLEVQILRERFYEQ